jgi:NAD(P)-dependent dehydrogenase (short-subunit alcohol dehydrogenase family)
VNIDLSGKRALVTGAASGIGAAVAEGFAAAGAHVAVHARSVEKAGPVVERIQAAGGSALPVEADLADSEAVREMVGKAIAGLGGIDIVMSNAGIYDAQKFLDLDEDDWEQTLAVNLKTPALISKLTIPLMIEQGRGGRQLFTSSISAKMAEEDGSAYCTSKAGLHAMMRCMALESGMHGITVNAICPGWVDTPMARRAWEELREEGQSIDDVYEWVKTQNMLGGMIEPVDIANMALFLASDQARYVTGQAINVCAGVCVTL